MSKSNSSKYAYNQKFFNTNLIPDKYLREFLLWLRLSSFINASDCEEANLKYNTKFSAKFLLAWHTQLRKFALNYKVYTF